MANSITLFKKYIDKLDEVYKQSAKTAVLDGDSTLAQMGANTNEIIVPKISMDGLGDYSRMRSDFDYLVDNLKTAILTLFDIV